MASSGGQIMPPLMGAGAFVMVELLRVPYTEIMVAALLPAVLFFVAVWVGVDSFAERYGLELRSVDDSVDPRFAFMPLDHDGRIRMDCSSPWAMARAPGTAWRACTPVSPPNHARATSPFLKSSTASA